MSQLRILLEGLLSLEENLDDHTKVDLKQGIHSLCEKNSEGLEKARNVQQGNAILRQLGVDFE